MNRDDLVILICAILLLCGLLGIFAFTIYNNQECRLAGMNKGLNASEIVQICE